MNLYLARFHDPLRNTHTRRIRACHSYQANIIAGKLAVQKGWVVKSVGRV